MDHFFSFIVLAILVEGITEYIKMLAEIKEKRTVVVRLCALSISVLLCLLSGADLFAAMNLNLCLPYVGSVLTGIFAARGANYASDLLGKINHGSNRT